MAAVIQILDVDDMQASLLTPSVVGLNSAHRRQPVANLHRLTDFGNIGRFAAHRITPPRRLDDTRFIQVGAFHALGVLLSGSPHQLPSLPQSVTANNQSPATEPARGTTHDANLFGLGKIYRPEIEPS
jgi:hypothetical protein